MGQDTAIFCMHANEVPATCPCDVGCFCRTQGSCAAIKLPTPVVETVIDYVPALPIDLRPRAVQRLRDAFQAFARNGRWGTCSGCPRDMQHHAYPEFCTFTQRYDHQLDARALATQFEYELRDENRKERERRERWSESP